MKVLALFALVAFAAANTQFDRYDYDWIKRTVPEENIVDTEFRPQREYTYFYNGQLMTGIPSSSEQHSATRVQALVSIVFKTQTEVYMQLRHIRFGYLNERVQNPRRMHSFEKFEPVQVEEELLQKLRQPIKFEYIHGMIKNLHFSAEEQPWSANIKRSVLHMLQVNMQKERRTDTYSELEPRSAEVSEESAKKFDFYTVMEEGIEGECETAYTIVSSPSPFGRIQEQQNVMNVTKTINFEKCERRPDIRYNFRFQDWCPSCEDKYNAHEKILRSSTIIKQNTTVSEDRRRILIESVIVESHYTFVPLREEGNLIQTYVNTTLKLVKTSSIENEEMLRASTPRKSDSQLVWTPDWDVAKEEFFMLGEEKFHEKTPYSQIREKVPFVKSILQKLVHYLRHSVEEEAPRQFARLVKIFRMLKKQEIEEIHEHFFKSSQVESFTREEHKKIKSLLIDTVAMCGTKQCIEHLVEKIEQREIKPLKAQFAIKKLMTTRTISEQMIEKIWILTSEEWCREAPVTVCQSAYLTVGSLLNGLCAPNKDKLALYFKDRNAKQQLCPRELKQRWVEKLFERFEKCDSELCKITVLKSVANAGLDLSIYKLEKIIKNKEGEHKYSQQVRVEAILATRQLIDYMPRKVEKILMPIYMNKYEHAYIRMAAFHKIMQSQPEKFILDQLTRSLFSEHNQQVASFVFTSLHAFANSTNPCEKRMADDLKLSLRHARYVPAHSWLQRSKFLRAQYFSKEYNKGVTLNFNSILSNYSVIPHDVATSLHVTMGNMWQRYMLTLGMSQSNIERFLRKIVRSYSHSLQDIPTTLSEIVEGRYNREQRDVSPKFRKELDNIFEELEITERDNTESWSEEKKSIALLYMRLMDQDYGFLPLTKEILPQEIIEMVEQGELSMSKVLKMAKNLLQKKSFDLPFDVQSATFLHESSRKIPTTFGMPLQLSTKSPAVAQASGVLKIKVDESMKKVEVALKDFKPSFTVSLVDKIEIWSPIVNTGLKFLYQTKVYAPFNGKLEVDFERQQPQIRFVWQPKEQEQGYELLRTQTRTVTTVLLWQRRLQEWKEPDERTIPGEQWTRVNTYKKQFGEKSLGVKFDIESMWHRTPEKHVPGTPLYPLAGPNKLVVRVLPGQDMPREVRVTLTGKLFEKLSRGNLSPKFENLYDSKSSDEMVQTDSEEWLDSKEERNYRMSSQEEKKLRKYHKEFSLSEPTSHQLKLVIEAIGSTIKREAVVEAGCQIDQQSLKAAECELKIKRTPIPEIESEEWELRTQAKFLFPQMPKNILEVTKDKKFVATIKTQWGSVDRKDKVIDIKIVGEQSPRMIRELEKSTYRKQFEQQQFEQRRSYFSPVAQYEQLTKYGVLDQYICDVDYKNVPVFVKNVTSKVFRALKTHYYWQTDVNKFFAEEQQDERYRMVSSNKDGEIRARFNIDPINLRYVNFTVEMPGEKVKMTDVPVWTPLRGLNMRRLSSPARNYYSLFVDMVSDYQKAVCEVRSDRISTFDNVEYPTPIASCGYSVLAKDCSSKQESKFAVLIKRVKRESELKVLKIVTEDVELIVKPQREVDSFEVELECQLNGEIKSCERIEDILVHKSHVALRVSKDEAGYVRLELPEAGLRVYFDGYSVNVKVSPFYRRSTCGMCGQYEPELMEENCELRTADNECISSSRPQELKRFFKSYLLDESKCSSEQSWFEKEEHYDEEQLPWEDERYEHILEHETEQYSPREVRPILKTRVIEQAHEICFSKTPVKRCPRNTHAIQMQEAPTQVSYACLPRNDYKAEEYLRVAHNEEIVREVEQLSGSYKQDERMPSKCIKDELDF